MKMVKQIPAFIAGLMLAATSTGMATSSCPPTVKVNLPATAGTFALMGQTEGGSVTALDSGLTNSTCVYLSKEMAKRSPGSFFCLLEDQ